jgi:hypothetical protein
LRNFHGDAVVADHRAHGADSIVEHVGVQAEEATNLKEKAHGTILESIEDAEKATDPVATIDLGADLGESGLDQASMHGRESTQESEPISWATRAASAVACDRSLCHRTMLLIPSPQGPLHQADLQLVLVQTLHHCLLLLLPLKFWTCRCSLWSLGPRHDCKTTL